MHYNPCHCRRGSSTIETEPEIITKSAGNNVKIMNNSIRSCTLTYSNITIGTEKKCLFCSVTGQH